MGSLKKSDMEQLQALKQSMGGAATTADSKVPAGKRDREGRAGKNYQKSGEQGKKGDNKHNRPGDAHGNKGGSQAGRTGGYRGNKGGKSHRDPVGKPDFGADYNRYLLPFDPQRGGGGYFNNPYTFFPLGGTVQRSPKGHPCYEGLTGSLECSLSIDEHSALFVPNTTRVFEDRKISDHKVYEFCSDDDLADVPALPEQGPEHPIIPGSEIRGMVRSVYEQLTNSCMLEIDEENCPNMRVPEPKVPCRLTYDDAEGAWRLYKLSADDVVLLKEPRTEKERKEGRYTRLNGVEYRERKLKAYGFYRCEVDRKHGTQKVFSCSGEEKSDTLYLAHITGQFKTKTKERKVRLFKVNGGHDPVLLCPKGEHQDLFLRFERVIDAYCEESTQSNHNAAAEAGYKEYSRVYQRIVRYSKDKAGSEKPLVMSIMVYVDDPADPQYMSPACITREYFINTVSQIADAQGGHGSCAGHEGFCPACQLFGSVGTNESIGSRVRFSDARYVGRAENSFYQTMTLPPLSSPKISSVEFYLQKPRGAKRWTYDYFTSNADDGREVYQPKLQGRKVYWHYPLAVPPKIAPTSQNITARLLKKGTFAFKVFFEDITQEQLSQLVFSIGGLEGRLQKLGHGKPLGLGSVMVKVESVAVQERRLAEDGTIKSTVKGGSELVDGSIAETPEARLIEFLAAPLWDVKAGKNNLGNMVSYPKVSENSTEHYQWFSANHPLRSNSAFHQTLYVRQLDTKDERKR